MDEMVRQRLVGAAVLALMAAILLPWLFGDPKDPRGSIQASFQGTPLPGAAARSTPPPTATVRPRPVESVHRPGATPSAIPTPRATPRATASPPASGWILQLASYRRQSAAEDFQARLRRDGYDAYRESVTIKGRTYHRVRLGLSMSRKEAAALQKKLEKRYRLQAQLLAAR